MPSQRLHEFTRLTFQGAAPNRASSHRLHHLLRVCYKIRTERSIHHRSTASRLKFVIRTNPDTLLRNEQEALFKPEVEEISQVPTGSCAPKFAATQKPACSSEEICSAESSQVPHRNRTNDILASRESRGSNSVSERTAVSRRQISSYVGFVESQQIDNRCYSGLDCDTQTATHLRSWEPSEGRNNSKYACWLWLFRSRQ